jgi:tRNA threonylcarbamoyladenosine biosynthesis protein TsaE
VNSSLKAENRFNVNSISELRAVLTEQIKKILPGATVALVGTLGVGKTTSTKILLELFGSQEAVSSPTFVLQHEYKLASGLVIEHWDLYRLNQLPEELVEPVGSNVIRLVEWADKFPDFLEQVDLILSFELLETSQVTTKGELEFDRFLSVLTKGRSI